jgi:hypothetical protein
MKLSAALFLLALAPVLSACAGLGDRPTAVQDATSLSATVAEGQIEPIHAVAIAQDQAVFWVSSNGCTEKADLNPVVRQTGDGSVITLRRIKEDRCRNARREGIEMRWSFHELGLAPGARVSVENPYQLPPTG